MELKLIGAAFVVCSDPFITQDSLELHSGWLAFFCFVLFFGDFACSRLRFDLPLHSISTSIRLPSARSATPCLLAFDRIFSALFHRFSYCDFAMTLQVQDFRRLGLSRLPWGNPRPSG